MFIHYRAQGFVLEKVDQGEADQLFTIFTKKAGKLKILARAIRKPKSKLRTFIPIFSICKIEFIQGKHYKTLTDSVVISDFENIKKSLVKLKTAYKITEAFNQLVKSPEKDEKIWQLLNEVFNHLNNYFLLSTHYPLIYYFFLWNLLSILGYKPELYKCLNCNQKLTPSNLYFSRQGGIICENCYKKAEGLSKKKMPKDLKIDENTIKILREIFKKDLKSFLKIKIKKEYFNSLKEISDFYISQFQNG